MNRLFAAAVVLALFAFASTGAQAAEQGHVSTKSLANMGFASAQPISDAEGMKIRGQGTGVALTGGHQVAHGATSAFALNINFASVGNKKAVAASFGIAIGRSF